MARRESVDVEVGDHTAKKSGKYCPRCAPSLAIADADIQLFCGFLNRDTHVADTVRDQETSIASPL